MDKPKGVVVIFIAVIVLLVVGLLLHLRGFDVPTDQVTVTTALFDTNNEGEQEGVTTKSVILNGSNSYIREKTGESQSERGLKSYEVEDFQEQLDKLRVRLGVPQSDEACDDGSTGANDSLAITEQGNTKGAVYFCDGVGIDETTNIVGPYQDLFKLIQDTEI